MQLHRCPVLNANSFEIDKQRTWLSPAVVPPAAAQPRGLVGWIGPSISLAILVAVGVQASQLNFARVWAMLPVSPLFWLVFAAAYLALPVSEWLIFDRLWRLPASGFVALLRKRVGNEVLLGYSGELYFYGWARRHGNLVAAPFGAVRDVAILSAVVGNLATLVMMASAWPLLAQVRLGVGTDLLLGFVSIVVLSSLGGTLLRGRLFSLSPQDLRFVAAIHSARTVVTSVLTACLWHLAMPDVAMSWWLLLSALRMIVTRLPFVPNKDLVFCGLAVFLIGRDAQISDLMAMMATLMLATHLMIGATLGVVEIGKLGSRA